MVDVSLPMRDMARIAAEAQVFTWIDHHKSAIDDYAENKDVLLNLKDMFTFLKVGKAACELAWQHFFDDDIPRAVFLLGTYDVWRNDDKQLWETKVMPFQYGMRLNCYSVETFPMELLEKGHPRLLIDVTKSGKEILSYQRGQNKGLMKGAFEGTVSGYRAICCNVGLTNFNSQSFASVFDPEKHYIMVAFCFLGPGKGYRVSFYSEDDGPDVSVIAKTYLGGGHAGASGCQVKDWREVIEF